MVLHQTPNTSLNQTAQELDVLWSSLFICPSCPGNSGQLPNVFIYSWAAQPLTWAPLPDMSIHIIIIPKTVHICRPTSKQFIPSLMTF